MDIGCYVRNPKKNVWLKSEMSEFLKGKECILGIDEAGRGPVLGPMVYTAAVIPVTHEQQLEELGVDDSKKLLPKERKKMMSKITEASKDYMAWICRILSPHQISTTMLRRSSYNLNNLSHDCAIQLIRQFMDSGIKVKKIFVDTVGCPYKYTEMLQRKYPTCEITVEAKADATYKIVGAASIVAKTCRDLTMEEWKFDEIPETDRNYGTGYTSDAKTKAWIGKHVDPVFGFPYFVRFSWKTAEKLMEENAVKVLWRDDEEEEEEEDEVAAKKQKMTALFASVQEQKRKKEMRKRHKFFANNCLKSATKI